MQHSNLGAVFRSAPSGLFALLPALLLGGAASAQAIAGSESRFVPAQGAPSGGGSATDLVGSTLDATVGQAASGELATSAGFQLETGVAWVIDAPASGPVVAGVLEGSGPKAGGDVVTVVGYNFTEPGAGPLSVVFGGVPSPNVQALSNLHAIAVTPPGLNAQTNPKALVDVRVVNAIGNASVSRGFDYTPSLVEDVHSRVGGTMDLRFHDDPGGLLALALGKSVPGFSIVLPPWDGAFEIVLNVQLLLNFVPTPDGTRVFHVNVPEDPNLVGGTLEFQAFSAHDLLAGDGGLSNLLQITFLP